MPTKRHHYLPQFYLARFIPPGEKCFAVYDKLGGPPRRQTPINTGVEGHLYTVLDPSGAALDSIETELLGPIDDAVAPIIANWKDGAPSSPGDIAIMATFLASLHVRSPRQITFAQGVGAAVAVKMGEDMARDPVAFADSVRRFNENNPEHTIRDVEALRQSMLHLGVNYRVSLHRKLAMVVAIGLMRDVAEELQKMHWIVLRASRGEHFVVGDSPLSVLLPDEDGRVDFGAGFGMPRVEVAFPLDPERCLYLRRYLSPLAPTTQDLNRCMIWQAERFVVSSQTSEDIEAVVKEFAFTVDLPLMDHNELRREMDKGEEPAP